MRPLRVLAVIASSGLGGAERALATTLEAFDPARVEAYVACHGSGPMFDDYRRHAAAAWPLDLGRVFDPRAVDRLARRMADARADIVHTQLWNADVLGVLAARRARVPIAISTVQGAYHPLVGVAGLARWRRRVLGLTYRAIYRRFDRVVAVSHAVRDDLVARRGLRVNPRRILVIPNALDLDRIEAALATPPPGAGERRIVAVANLVPVKGHEWLIRAAPRIRSACPDARLLLVGDGPCRASLERLVRDVGVADVVTFAGSVRNPLPLVRASAVFVLPSLGGGLPVALLEALAVRTPVVASRAGSIPEVVEDGRTGLLVPPGDARALADAVVRLLGDPDLARRLREAGAETIRTRFLASAVVPRIEALYSALAEPKRIR